MPSREAMLQAGYSESQILTCDACACILAAAQLQALPKDCCFGKHPRKACGPQAQRYAVGSPGWGNLGKSV